MKDGHGWTRGWRMEAGGHVIDGGWTGMEDGQTMTWMDEQGMKDGEKMDTGWRRVVI